MSNFKQGYKQTDIGVIPEDWGIAELGEISKYQGGSQPDISFFSTRKYNGFIRLIQIRDYKTDKYTVYIPEGLARRKCNKDDIMIGRYGPPIFQILKGLEGAYNVALIKAMPNVTLDKSFYYHTLKREDLFQLIELLSRRSSGQTGVDLVGLKSFKIGLPPLNEQTAIATALSDTDALIAALDKKIAKKQQIKQGTMQQLLTGKKRLSGFSGEWVEIVLGSVCEVKRGQMIVSSEFVKGPIPVIAGGMTPAGYHNLSNRNENTITISASGANAGFIGFHKSPIFASDCSTINENENIDIRFIYYTLKLKQEEIYNSQTGGAQPHIHPKDIEPLILNFPIDKSEQTAIAQILTDMDNEIAQLEKERDKYKEMKAGMMQELLTGKIRLI